MTSLGSWFTTLFNNVLSLPQTIVDLFKKLLNALFVPESGFLDNKISELKTSLAKRFHMDSYSQLVDALKSYKAGKVSFNGYIDTSIWTDHMGTVKNLIRAFFYPLLMFGCYKFLVWLLRGSPNPGTEG